MTREEAINQLKDFIILHREQHGWDVSTLNALDMAIKALEQTRWIPVTERLPEIHQDVFLSLRSLDVVVGFRAATEPYFYCQGDYIEPQDVLAWVPKLEPYTTEVKDDV